MKKIINLSFLLLIGLTAGSAYAQQLEMRATVTPQKQLERMELPNRSLEDLKPLMFHLDMFLETGVQTGKWTQQYTREDAFLAYVAAMEIEETPDPESLYQGEEFLQEMNSLYPQNAPYPFPKQWTSALVTHMMNQLPYAKHRADAAKKEFAEKSSKDPLHHYARVFLNTAIETGHLPASIETKTVKAAFQKARTEEMDFREEDLEEAEELLQEIRNSHQFPLEFTPVFVAKVLNVLR